MLEPGKILGPFRIESELGSGAMGTVFKAVYVETNQPVAIKWIAMNLAANDTALARFEREADILKQLKHPNIVRLFATGRYKKTPFFAMEYVEGESLDRVLERRGRFTWEDVVRLGKQLCKALQHAHEKGIIHRDLKPSNLMILKDGTLKLTDFGIAKDVDVTALTGANVTVGTAAYMSPEQCHGERNLTAKSDLYSLGVVFYELLTGEKPFKKETPVEMFLAHVNDPFERPSRLALEIPTWLDTLVCQLMEKKPEHRPFDAAMVKKILDEVEEKATEQRSAGLDAIAGKGVNAADREAVRRLRAGSKKKKIRERTVHFYEKPAFLAFSIPMVLLLMVAFIWWMTRPPSAATLYDRASAAIKAGQTETVLPILEQFVSTYPSLTDPNSEQMRQWFEKLTVDQDEKAMHNRVRRNISADGEGQKIVYSAIASEDAGEFVDARQRWQELQSKYDSATEPKDKAWAWLAKRKLQSLDDLKKVEEQLSETWTKAEKTSHDAERRSAEALRFERFGDWPEALNRWTKVKEMFLKDFEQRRFVLLAANKMREIKPKVVGGDAEARAFRVEQIQTRLAQVDQLLKEPVPANLKLARGLCNDIVELYGSDPDPQLPPLVKQAKDRLEKMPK